jgi:ubiquitin C-terminal hydrolase
MEPKGIQNLGNTCFMNSIFQSLLSIEGFVQRVDCLERCSRDFTFSKASGEDPMVYLKYTIAVFNFDLIKRSFHSFRIQGCRKSLQTN